MLKNFIQLREEDMTQKEETEMDTIMNQLKKSVVLRGVVFIIFGLITIISPNGVFQTVVYFISAYIAIMGILNIFDGIKIKKETNAYGVTFIGGWTLLILAVFVLVFAKGIVSILPIILGLGIAVSGVTRCIQAVNLRQYVNVNWVPMFIYGAVLIIAALILTFNPFSSILVLVQLFGGILILMGIGEFATFLQLRKIN